MSGINWRRCSKQWRGPKMQSETVKLSEGDYLPAGDNLAKRAEAAMKAWSKSLPAKKRDSIPAERKRTKAPLGNNRFKK